MAKIKSTQPVATTYVLHVYEGVEQNEYGHWYANKLAKTDKYFVLKNDATPKDICSLLKADKVIDTADMRKVEAIQGESMIEIREKKGLKPICRLVATTR